MDAELAVEHLRALIRIPTVSRAAPESADESEFEAFRALLASLYALAPRKGPSEMRRSSVRIAVPVVPHAGLVHIAAARGDTFIHRECRFGAIGRSEVRLATVAAALELLSELV